MLHWFVYLDWSEAGCKLHSLERLPFDIGIGCYKYKEIKIFKFLGKLHYQNLDLIIGHGVDYIGREKLLSNTIKFTQKWYSSSMWAIKLEYVWNWMGWKNNYEQQEENTHNKVNKTCECWVSRNIKLMGYVDCPLFTKFDVGIS